MKQETQENGREETQEKASRRAEILLGVEPYFSPRDNYGVDNTTYALLIDGQRIISGSIEQGCDVSYRQDSEGRTERVISWSKEIEYRALSVNYIPEKIARAMIERGVCDYALTTGRIWEEIREVSQETIDKFRFDLDAKLAELKGERK